MGFVIPFVIFMIFCREEAQKLIASGSVLVSGMNGLGVEISF
jgi:hypothetical protein